MASLNEDQRPGKALVLTSGKNAFCPAVLVRLDAKKEMAFVEAKQSEYVFVSSIAVFASLLLHATSEDVILRLLEPVLPMKLTVVERRH